MMEKLVTLCAVGLLLLGLAGPAQALVPTTVGIQGRLVTAAGGPVADGQYTVTFRLYSTQNAAQASWSETAAALDVKSGAWKYALGTAQPLDAAVIDASKGAWLGLQVGNEAELSRIAVQSAPFAVRALVAEGLQCSGCVTAGMLDPGVLAGFAKTADLAAYVKTADLAGYAKTADLSVYAKTSTLPDVAKTGAYGDLSGLPVLAKVGTSCGSGLVVKGIKADGSLDCVSSTLDASALPADGLAAVSNGIMTNVFPSIFASSTAPKAVPDNDPFGILDDIVVPDKGVVTALTVAVDISNSDTTGLKVTLLDPSNAAYVLYNGGVVGTSVKGSYPDVQKPVSGDLGAWVGKNPKGKWRLQVVDTKAGPGGNDGQLNGWSISVKTLSSGVVQVKGDLLVDGGVTVGGKALPQVWTAENLALAPGETLSIDTKLGDVPLAVSAWVKVGAEWKLITPNVPETACPACGNGEDGDFAPTSDVQLQAGRFYHFRNITVPAGVTVSSTVGVTWLAAAGKVVVDGTVTVDGNGFAGGVGNGGGGSSGSGPGGGAGASGTIAGGGAGFSSKGEMSTGFALGGASYAAGPRYQIKFGSGGGAGGGMPSSGDGCNGHPPYPGGVGGAGGGALLITAPTVSVGSGGKITANGNPGAGAPYNPLGCYGSITQTGGAGGGGSGGVIWLRAGSVVNNGVISAQGGLGGTKLGQPAGGKGSDGYIFVDSGLAIPVTNPVASTVSLDGLPGADAAGMEETLAGGIAKLKNIGQVSRGVRLVVIR